jgi:hypothetical protein
MGTRTTVTNGTPLPLGFLGEGEGSGKLYRMKVCVFRITREVHVIKR